MIAVLILNIYMVLILSGVKSLDTRFTLVTGYIEHLQIVTAHNALT